MNQQINEMIDLLKNSKSIGDNIRVHHNEYVYFEIFTNATKNYIEHLYNLNLSNKTLFIIIFQFQDNLYMNEFFYNNFKLSKYYIDSSEIKIKEGILYFYEVATKDDLIKIIEFLNDNVYTDFTGNIRFDLTLILKKEKKIIQKIIQKLSVLKIKILNNLSP
jgi:hypothetical protein